MSNPIYPPSGNPPSSHANPGKPEFFEDLSNSKPYFKAALEGFASSGKTRTMVELAIGVHKKIGSTKPIVSFDTEEAMQWNLPLFDAAKIQVKRKRSRTLTDLMQTMAMCRSGYSDILMIDSISHVWEDYLASYMRQKKRTRLEFQDWGVIKPLWKKEFSEVFVRDPYHCLMTGRAGYEYSDEKDADGKRQIYKSGVKMKVEGETAYEPDCLIMMERFEDVVDTDNKRVWREGTILKDRSGLIDGKTFKNPRFQDFEPMIDFALAKPNWNEIREKDAAELFENEDAKKAFFQRRDIALEKIEAEMTAAWPGQAAEAKRAKVEALRTHFGSTSWTEVSKMHPEKLESGLAALQEFVAKAKSEAEAATVS